MKQGFIYSALVALLLTAGCAGKCDEKKIVSEVAYEYIIATGNYELDKAMPYASKETRERTLPFLKEKILPLTDTDYLKANVPATATIDSVLIEGDSAWVGYTKTTPLNVTHGTLALVKEEGKWLAYVPLNI